MLSLVEQSKPENNEALVEAFGEMYSAVWKDMYRYAHHYLGNKEDAEDAVQDTAIEAFKGISGLQSKDSFKSWIFSILVCRCKKKLSDTIRRRNTVNLSEVEFSLESDNDSLQRFEDAQAVLSAIKDLSKINREVMALSIIGGLTNNEIAQILGLPASTVRSRITRSLKTLKKSLKDATQNDVFEHL